jgi:hypothetical protein
MIQAFYINDVGRFFFHVFCPFNLIQERGSKTGAEVAACMQVIGGRCTFSASEVIKAKLKRADSSRNHAHHFRISLLVPDLLCF